MDDHLGNSVLVGTEAPPEPPGRFLRAVHRLMTKVTLLAAYLTQPTTTITTCVKGWTKTVRAVGVLLVVVVMTVLAVIRASHGF